MPTRRQLIQKIELNSDQSSVTFSGIPQNYTDLKIVASTRNSSTFSGLNIEFNSSSSGYSHRRLYGSGSTVASDSETTQPDIWIGLTNSSAYTTNTFDNNEIYIPNYTSSNNKSVFGKSCTENNTTESYIVLCSGLWANTSAITSIRMFADSGNLAANSTFYLYGITHVPIIRGGEEYVLDGFKYHKFTSTAALQVIEPGDVEYLVVAGGGGGGSSNTDYFSAAGGGAGGFISSKYKISNGVFPVTIGAGGSGGATATGNPGNNSSVGSLLIANAGGWGAGDSGGSSSGTYGSAGGTVQGNGPSTVDGTQGNNGGVGSSGGGGGGGASSVGQGHVSSYTGGAGGAGKQFPSNSGVYYSGGGGGGTSSYYTTNLGGAGGIGGGGSGGTGTIESTAGVANTGGGGGGGGSAVSVSQRNGASGGSGIVIIRYPYDGN